MLLRKLLLKYESCLYSQHLAFYPLKQLLVSGRFVGSLCVYICTRFLSIILSLQAALCWFTWCVVQFNV